MTRPRIWRVRFDEALWQADLRGASASARSTAADWRERIAVLRGIPHAELVACRAEDDEGLHLPHCVKTRIPNPGSASIRDSPWGAILEIQHDGDYFLSVLAFGLRHPEAIGSAKPSVYQVAHGRLVPDA